VYANSDWRDDASDTRAPTVGANVPTCPTESARAKGDFASAGTVHAGLRRVGEDVRQRLLREILGVGVVSLRPDERDAHHAGERSSPESISLHCLKKKGTVARRH
jgi:hypothetical protein